MVVLLFWDLDKSLFWARRLEDSKGPLGPNLTSDRTVTSPWQVFGLVVRTYRILFYRSPGNVRTHSSNRGITLFIKTVRPGILGMHLQG